MNTRLDAAQAARPAGGGGCNAGSDGLGSPPSPEAIAVRDRPGLSNASVPALEARGGEDVTVRLSPENERVFLFWKSPIEALHPPSVVSAVVGLAELSLKRMRKDGEGPAFTRRGARIYYRGRDVIDWMGGA